MSNLKEIRLRVYFQDLPAGIRSSVFIEFRKFAHVGRDKQDIRPVADLFYRFLNRRIAGFKGCIADPFLIRVPPRHIRCTDADNCQPDASALKDRPARSGHIVPILIQDIRSQHRKPCLAQDLLHGRYAPVKLVVSERHGIIFHLIHGSYNGMLAVRILVCNRVCHYRALNGVAAVYEKHNRILFPDLIDISMQTCHTGMTGFLIILVGIAPDIPMQIRCA